MSRPPTQGLPAAPPLAGAPLTSAPPLALQLLISQAVCRLGTAASWASISQLIESAEEWPEHSAKMTQQGYESAFNDMMGSKGLDALACSQPQARPVRKLIHSLYSDLLLSLRDQILSSHSQEVKLKSEVSQIGSGQVDSLLFNSSSQPIKDRITENQRRQEQEREGERERERERARKAEEDEEQNRRRLESAAEQQKRGEALPAEAPTPAAITPNTQEQGEATKVSQRSEPGGHAEPDDETLEGESATNTTVEGERSGEIPPVEESDEHRDNGVNGEDEDGEERTGKMRARKPTIAPTGSRRGQQKKIVGGRASKGRKELEEDIVEPDQNGEEDDTVAEEGADDNGGEEDEELEEGDAPNQNDELEEEKKRPARKRAAASRKGSRSHKRKASDPSPSVDSPAPEESPESAGHGPAAKRKRGGRKSRVETEAEQDDASETKDSKKLVAERKKNFTRIVDSVRGLPFSNLFESRVTKTQAPNYSAAVKRSTCLKDIAKKIKSGEVSDNVELMREFAVLCANAVQFNGIDQDDEVSVGRQARELWEAFEREMNETLAQDFSIADGP
ncbi:hypothetical protein JCM11491_003778 [Sporobolomyces phaffii]